MIILHNNCYYIALNKATELNDIILYQNAVVELLKIASTADAFYLANDSVFHACQLLEELALTPEQAEGMERLPGGNIFREELPGKVKQ